MLNHDCTNLARIIERKRMRKNKRQFWKIRTNGKYAEKVIIKGHVGSVREIFTNSKILLNYLLVICRVFLNLQISFFYLKYLEIKTEPYKLPINNFHFDSNSATFK